MGFRLYQGCWRIMVPDQNHAPHVMRTTSGHLLSNASARGEILKMSLLTPLLLLTVSGM